MDFANDHLSKHELRELRREARKEDRKTEEEKHRGAKKRQKILTYVVLVFVLIGIGFGVYSLSFTGNSIKPGTNDYIQAQLATIPNSFVHWHADADVIVCGENKQLPLAAPGSLLGTHRMHTHDKISNAGSLPNSDGNGVMHNEGNLHEAPFENTLGKFFQNLGIPLSENGVFNVKDGDKCPDGNVGELKVFVNDKEQQDDFFYYIPRDGDRIRVVFGPEQSSGN